MNHKCWMIRSTTCCNIGLNNPKCWYCSIAHTFKRRRTLHKAKGRGRPKLLLKITNTMKSLAIAVLHCGIALGRQVTDPLQVIFPMTILNHSLQLHINCTHASLYVVPH